MYDFPGSSFPISTLSAALVDDFIMSYNFTKIFCCISIRLLTAQFQILLAKYCRHLWYLTSKTVPFSLFSYKLNKAEKSALADCLLALQAKTTLFFNPKIVLGMVSQASQK